MKYITNLQSAKEKILSLYPEFSGSRFTGDDSGWCNYAVKVDDKFLFRFSRNAESSRVLKAEAAVLEILRQKLPAHIQVPHYLYQNLEGDGPFVGYRMIEGAFLTKEVFDALSAAEKDRLRENMAVFLQTLHAIEFRALPLDELQPVPYYREQYESWRKICFPYLDPALRKASVMLFEAFFQDETLHRYTPAVVHGDLSEDHILLTQNGVGIIDFGDIRIFDPAFDFIWAYGCDPGFFRELIKNVRGNTDDAFVRRIQSFYSKITAFPGIVYGKETQNNAQIQKELRRLRKDLLPGEE